MIAEDSGVRIELRFVAADRISTRFGHVVDGGGLPFRVASAMLRYSPEESLPLLDVRAPRPDEGDCDAVLEFGTWPENWDAADLIITSVADPDGMPRVSSTLPHCSDPRRLAYEPALVDKVESWLFSHMPRVLRGNDRNGWWAYHLKAPPQLAGVVTHDLHAWHMGDHSIVLSELVWAPSGLLLTVGIDPDPWASVAELDLINGLATATTQYRYLAECEVSGVPGWPNRIHPRLSLRQVGSQELLPGDITGPWTPLQNRYYMTFPPSKTPVVAQLEGVLGVPVRPNWSCSFSTRSFFEMSDWHVEADLGPVQVRGTIKIDVGTRDSGLLLICPHITLEEGPVDQMWIAGAMLEDAAGNTYEVSEQSTVFIEWESRYRTGLAFPPAHEVGENVTLHIQSIDVTFRVPLESPVLNV